MALKQLVEELSVKLGVMEGNKFPPKQGDTFNGFLRPPSSLDDIANEVLQQEDKTISAFDSLRKFDSQFIILDLSSIGYIGFVDANPANLLLEDSGKYKFEITEIKEKIDDLFIYSAKPVDLLSKKARHIKYQPKSSMNIQLPGKKENKSRVNVFDNDFPSRTAIFEGRKIDYPILNLEQEFNGLEPGDLFNAILMRYSPKTTDKNFRIFQFSEFGLTGYVKDYYNGFYKKPTLEHENLTVRCVYRFEVLGLKKEKEKKIFYCRALEDVPQHSNVDLIKRKDAGYEIREKPTFERNRVYNVLMSRLEGDMGLFYDVYYPNMTGFISSKNIELNESYLGKELRVIVDVVSKKEGREIVRTHIFLT